VDKSGKKLRFVPEKKTDLRTVRSSFSSVREADLRGRA